MSPPTTIAHYRITAKLGEGGMGEVWRATDTKLDRDVAIKILPDSFAGDPDRLARFTREAKVLASLNHPNIAAIYGVEERALVMELVEGPTLADRIAQSPIALEEALPIASQIAEALEYAHDRGIVHRDLKPANIKVTPDGRVKLLDFGLAKATEDAPAVAGSPTLSPTMSLAMTQLGMILGTAAYMSPEQARGKPVDKRADIWAFGVVLYEMLAGRLLFGGGETVTDTIASVVTKEPDWNALPADTPPHIRRLIERCLRKDPKMRLRDIGEVRILLDEPPEAALAAVAIALPRRAMLPWTIAFALTTLVAGGIAWRATRPEDRPMLRFSADLGPDAVAGGRTTAAISRDGTRIAYPVRSSGGTQLATRLMDQSRAIVLSGTEDARDPFFSPNGQWIGFFAGGKLKKISVQGGAPLTLCEDTAPAGDRGASWGEDGTIVATLDVRHLFRIPEAGGKPQLLPLKLDDKDPTSYRYPQILPGGEAVLVSGGTVGNFDDANIAAVSLRTGDLKIVARGGYFGRYLPSGHLIYIHQGTLFAVPFDARRIEAHGTPAPILQDIAGNATAGGGQLDFSRSGTLVYLSGSSGTYDVRTVVWMDAAGKKIPLGTHGGAVLTPRLSPDGKSLALSVNGDIFIYDPQRGAMTRITSTGDNRYPVWTPDGKHLVYGTAAGGIWWTRPDGSGQPQRILEATGSSAPGAFSPDGRRLALFQGGGGANPDIRVLPLDTTDSDHPRPGNPELLPRTRGQDVEPAFSPDGRWLAYTSTESGQFEVYVRPYPLGAASGKWQISTAGGHFPIWSRTAKELFYETFDGHIMVVDYIAQGETFSPGRPRQWSDTPILVTGTSPNLDLAPDGKRFVVFSTGDTAGGEKASLHVTFLVNFFDELKRRMP